MSSKTKNALAFWQRTYNEHGYYHTEITVYSYAIGQYADKFDRPIGELQAECILGNYQTQDICDRVRAAYGRMVESGVTSVAQTLYVPRVVFSWLHYEKVEHTDRYCPAHIRLREAPRDLHADYAIFQRIERALIRTNGEKHGTYDMWKQPSHVQAYLRTARALELHPYTERFDGYTRSELVTFAPFAAVRVSESISEVSV